MTIPDSLTIKIKKEIFNRSDFYSTLHSMMCSKEGISKQIEDMISKGKKEFKIYFMVKKDSSESPTGYNLEMLSLHIDMDKHD